MQRYSTPGRERKSELKHEGCHGNSSLLASRAKFISSESRERRQSSRGLLRYPNKELAPRISWEGKSER